MVYKVIGLMSGSSLDGLDIVYTQIEEIRGKWSATILHAECVPYNEEWLHDLHHATILNVPDFLRLNTRYGRYIGNAVSSFIEKNELAHKVNFVASHGHTVFHEPTTQTTCQIGDGASIAAILQLPVINDLRSLDIAFGGQGAPIVPIGDRLLFGEYDLLLNLGGIANISIRNDNAEYTAFDICVANQALNYLAAQLGKSYDENGMLASNGKLLPHELMTLSQADYYKLDAPKSLSNELAMSLVRDFIDIKQYAVEDKLHTIVALIVSQIKASIVHEIGAHAIAGKKMLVTGGGAFNTFLMQQLQSELSSLGIEIILPEKELVMYKEALVMALIGTLRWREDVNVLSQATGSLKDSVGGSFWIGV
jgi:anhydro-N-acetylmuramic acid kinase